MTDLFLIIDLILCMFGVSYVTLGTLGNLGKKKPLAHIFTLWAKYIVKAVL